VEGEASLEEAAGETAAAAGEKPANSGFFRNLFKRDKEENPEPAKKVTAPPEEEEIAPPKIVSAAETEAEPEKKGFLKRWFGKDEEEETETAAETQVATADTAKAMTILEGNATPEQEARVIAIADYEKGMSYSFGEGVEKDSAEAFRWFLKSAEQGHAPAQYKVGVAYAYGDGVAQDPVEAAGWYRKAALQGYALAQRNLGTMYAQGEGLDADKPLAFAWYSVLADSGNVMDIRRRDQLQSELSQEEYRRALEIKETLLGSIRAGGRE
jgi:TPR repeat protein